MGGVVKGRCETSRSAGTTPAAEILNLFGFSGVIFFKSPYQKWGGTLFGPQLRFDNAVNGGFSHKVAAPERDETGGIKQTPPCD